MNDANELKLFHNALKKVNDKDKYADLARQIITEYTIAWKNQKPKKDLQEKRLKLYNNQRRDQSKVGDTTLFTIHQTITASLYIDRLSVVFEGRTEGDDEVAENLTALAEYDYEDMGKDELDYFWIWDAAFFGRGFVSLEEYIRDPDKGIYLPVPHVLDPITLLRDPMARSVNGDRTGMGAARFLGYEARMTRRDIEENPNMIKENLDFSAINFESGTQSVLQDAISARQLAAGLQESSKFTQENLLGANAEYPVTIWYTHYKNPDTGKVQKVKVWLVNERTKVIGIRWLKDDKWPIIDRPLYPHSHDWDGTSVTDLVEDKQRARAVLANLGLQAVKADVYPMYIYDSNKITNRNDLNFNFNKFIPVDAKEGGVRGVIEPLVKARPNLPLLNFIFETLDASAQKATATPEIQQGMLTPEKRTLGEVNIVTSKVDTRYSLAAKVFGWSEKRFWRRWYQMYKEHFADKIDEKVIRIKGAFGTRWRPLRKEDIVAKLDPDVKIESTNLSRAKQLEERANLTAFFSLAFQDPTVNRRYGLKKLGRLFLKKDEIDRLFPPTIDERIAEQENEKLNNNEFVEVKAEDDHIVHLEIHAKANETEATLAHMKTHEKALSIKKSKPELFPKDTNETALNQVRPQEITKLLSGVRPIQPSQTSGQAEIGGRV